MSEVASNPFNQLTIDELLLEKQTSREELALAYRSIEEIRGKMNLLDQAINRLKMPSAGTSRANRMAALPIMKTTKRDPEPTVVETLVVQKPKRKEYFQPSISEHALVRYMERVMKIDVEGLRSSILNKEIRTALSMGVTSISLNGIKMIARDGKILTVLD